MQRDRLVRFLQTISSSFTTEKMKKNFKDTKKKQIREKKDGIKMLKRRYVKWREKQGQYEQLEIEEYLIEEPYELDLDLKFGNKKST